MHQTFNFPYLTTPWDAAALRTVIDASLAAYGEVGAPSTWVLSNHDVVRHASRLGYPAGPVPPGPGSASAIRSRTSELGLRRARAASMLMLALPGSAYLYQGEELGLPEHTEMPDRVPAGSQLGQEELHRTRPGRGPRAAAVDLQCDGVRLRRPARPPGFRSRGYGRYARDLQEVEPTSTLGMYRSALALRREFDLGRGELEWTSEPGAAVLAFRRGELQVICNLGRTPFACPPARSCCCRAARTSRPTSRPTAACGGALSRNGRRSALLRRRRRHRG